MGLGQQSKKVQAAVWMGVAALLVGAGNLLGKMDPWPTPPGPRTVEAEKKQDAEEAERKRKEPTTDAVELRFRKLEAELEQERKERAFDRAVTAALWSELYEETARRVQLEALVRQPKNRTAMGDALSALEARASSACPATPAALEEDRKKPLHKAGDSALRALKIDR